MKEEEKTAFSSNQQKKERKRMCKHPLPASLHSRPISPLPHPSSQIIPFFQWRKYTSPPLHMPPGGHTYYMQETGFLRTYSSFAGQWLPSSSLAESATPTSSFLSFLCLVLFLPSPFPQLSPPPTPPLYFPHPHPLRNEGGNSPKSTYNAPKQFDFLSLSKRLFIIFFLCVAKVSNLFFALILPHYSFSPHYCCSLCAKSYCMTKAK